MKAKLSNNPNTKITGGPDDIISGLIAWTLDPNASQHCTVTGGPGAGKTHLIKELYATYESYTKLNILADVPELIVTGTTHECLGVLSKHLTMYDLTTIYSQLGLVPSKGIIHKRSGKYTKPAAYNPTHLEMDYTTDHIFVCDESNFISQETLTLITKWFPKIRIIFIGSENQLGTSSGPSKIFTQGWDNFFLNTSYRAGNAEVQEVYDNSENDVINQAEPSYIQNSSVVYLKTPEWEDTIKKAYTSPKAQSCITLAHTNKRVFELVGMIRQAMGRPGYFDLAGPTQALRAGSSFITKKSNIPLRRDTNGDVYIPFSNGRKSAHRRSYVGTSYAHYEFLASKKHKRRPEEVYPSLVASTQAKTIHGAQGGTWDYVFLDLVNLLALKKWDQETFRRAKHVAESRHRIKLFVRIE